MYRDFPGVKTRSGRVSRPTFKVREMIRNTVSEVLKKLTLRLEDVEFQARRAMKSEVSKTKVNKYFGEWNLCYQEFGDTCSEFGKLLSDEELKSHQDRCVKTDRHHQRFREEVEEYLATGPKLNSSPRAAFHQQLSAEASRLEKELRQIESRLSGIRLSRGNSTLSLGSITGECTPPRFASTDNEEDLVRAWLYPQPGAEPVEGVSRVGGDVPVVGSAPVVPPVIPPSPSSSSTSDALTRLADLLADKRNQLPQIEPEIFSGDIMEYSEWISSFETYIESKTSLAHERLFFLSKYTRGEARESISALLKLRSEEAYSRAKVTLSSRFGNRYRIAEAYRRKLLSWPPMKKGEPKKLLQLSDYMWQCEAAMKDFGQLNSLNAIDEMVKVLRILPGYLAERWDRVVDKWCYAEAPDLSSDLLPDQRSYPPFVELCRFVAQEARVVNGPTRALMAGDETVGTGNRPAPRPSYRSTVHATATDPWDDDVPERPDDSEVVELPMEGEVVVNAIGANGERRAVVVPKCFYCQAEHWIVDCAQFLGQAAEQRKEFAVKTGLCFGCLRRSHTYRSCRSRNPALLSDEPQPTHTSTTLRTLADEPVLETDGRATTGFLSSIVMGEVSHVSDPSRSFKTYILLDSQSDSCFVSDELKQSLQLPTTEVELRLTTMGSSAKIRSDLVTGLLVRGVNQTEAVKMPKCYTRQYIPANRESIPDPANLTRWEHLKEVAMKMPEYDADIPVGMLVGFNCPAAFIPRACQQDGDEKPFAVYTSVGWMVMGAAGEVKRDEVVVHRTTVKEVKRMDFSRAFDLDFKEPEDSEVKVSQDEVLFERCVQNTLHQTDDGHYEMDLPFKVEPADLPNNRPMALKRLMHLQKRLQRDADYCQKYQAFMSDMLKNGYAEVVETEPEEGRVLYTPHHGVISASKPGQVRPVFDGGATFQGVSLNSLLLVGTEEPNNLAGVLCNFRDEKVGFMCDVKSMFYQVRVSSRHRDFLRFLWFEGGVPDGRVIECRMCVHLFGAASSPSCSNVAFRRNAEDQKMNYGQEVINFIQRQFYVDDGLASRARAEQVVRLFLDSHRLCKDGGFHLCKFVCNLPEVAQHIPEELLGKSLIEWRISGKDLPTQTSLGLIWDLLSDSFRFVVQDLLKKMTRRGLLSALCSVYDPLGLIAPIILVGRLIVQSLCARSLAWDDVIPKEEADQWTKWYEELKKVETIRIPRCIRENTSGMDVKVEMHHFCDASQLGYGVCSYIKLTSETGEVDVSLLYSKARVAPKKPVTIPRMELQAAVLAVKVAAFLKHELIYSDIVHRYWSDSRVTLGYIKNSTRRFRLYVANRVTTIREISTPDQWSYVPTDMNPADLASRGTTPQKLSESSLWWHGPQFVRDGTKPDGAEDTTELEDDPEVKREVISLKTMVEEESVVARVLSRVSDWRRAARVMVWCMRYVGKLRRAVSNLGGELKRAEPELITLEEIARAELVMIRRIQTEVFPIEYAALEAPVVMGTRAGDRCRKNRVKVSSSLYRLDVFRDEEGLMRVGGRLTNSDLPLHVRCPILLPRKHRLTDLIVMKNHQRCGHNGRQSTLAFIRNAGYWIVSGRSAVDRCTRSCVTCKRLKGRVMEQKMANLPADRVADDPPFVHAGVDVFGPYQVKEGRSYKKRWVCIFVCLVMKAAHLEPLHSLSTDSFLNAFRRLINRRGEVKTLRSDCGTNFIGAENEMQAAMDEQKIHDEMSAHRCQWVSMKFNAPKASHMGGIWERPIQSIKRVFNSILHQNPDQLTDEILHTFLTEAENIYNSRPLTPVDMSDPLAEPPLCPGDLLTFKRTHVLDFPGVFPPEDVYARQHWRRVQMLRQTFMKRWRKEYLLAQQPRKKWSQVRRNLALDDVVLMVDTEAHRSDWQMGIVIAVETGDDDLVRKATVKTRAGQFTRPVQRLVYLLSPAVPVLRSNLPSDG